MRIICWLFGHRWETKLSGSGKMVFLVCARCNIRKPYGEVLWKYIDEDDCAMVNCGCDAPAAERRECLDEDD